MADTHTYYLKWKGQSSGPFSIPEIEAKLQRREVSSLHEIEVDGKWVTLRAFMARREQQRAAAVAAAVSAPTAPSRPTSLPPPLPGHSSASMPRPAPPGTAREFNPAVSQPDAAAASFFIRAGFTLRVVAALLDAIVFMAGIMVMEQLHWLALGSPPSILDLLNMPNFVWVAGWLMITLAGAAMMEGSPLQGTPGKWALGLVVTDRNGLQLNTAQAFKRALLKLVGALPFGFGWFMAAFNQDGRCMHDMIADTHVVLRVTATRMFR